MAYPRLKFFRVRNVLGGITPFSLDKGCPHFCIPDVGQLWIIPLLLRYVSRRLSGARFPRSYVHFICATLSSIARGDTSGKLDRAHSMVAYRVIFGPRDVGALHHTVPVFLGHDIGSLYRITTKQLYLSTLSLIYPYLDFAPQDFGIVKYDEYALFVGLLGNTVVFLLTAYELRTLWREKPVRFLLRYPPY